MEFPSRLLTNPQKKGTGALVAGIVLLIIWGIGLTMDRQQAYQSYLLGFLYWGGISIASLGFLLLQYMVGGGWSLIMRRSLEAAARLFPLLILLFLPIVFGMKDIFVWARPEVVAKDPHIAAQTGWLNPGFFVIRAAIYFGCWIGLTQLLLKNAVRQDRGEDAWTVLRRFRVIGSTGIVLFLLTASFAFVDWMMSIEPHYNSSIYSLMELMGAGITAVSWHLLAVVGNRERPEVKAQMTTQRLHDLGNILFAFLLLWTYMSFSQFILTWMANLPEEITWYLARENGGWQWVILFIFLGHFVLPFFLLLMREVKRRPYAIATVALWMLIVRFIDVTWIITPGFYPGHIHYHWLDLVAFLGIGGVWIGAFCRLYSSVPMMPLHDPRLLRGAHV